MRVGIIGGTFDPIHLGHLIIAEEARIQLELEQVIFIPTGQPWLKAGRPLTPGQHRLKMVRLAIASNPYFRAASNEVDRPGPSYTVDTLVELREELGPAASLYFILGRDALEQFHQWKEPERLLELCNLVVVNRPGHPKDDFSTLLARYPQAADKVMALSAPLIDISGTEIRRRAASWDALMAWLNQLSAPGNPPDPGFGLQASGFGRAPVAWSPKPEARSKGEFYLKAHHEAVQLRVKACLRVILGTPLTMSIMNPHFTQEVQERQLREMRQHEEESLAATRRLIEFGKQHRLDLTHELKLIADKPTAKVGWFDWKESFFYRPEAPRQGYITFDFGAEKELARQALHH